ALPLAASCSRDKLPLYPVAGKVFVDKKAADGAIVWLHPVDAPDPSVPKPRGRVGKDGSFQLGTFAGDDGAPAGSYRVTVFWAAPGKGGDENGQSLLPARYQSPETSGLPVVTIAEGANDLPPFQLTRR